MMGAMTTRIRCGGKPMTAIVLAGGRGRRMRADKAGLDVGGRTLLEHVLAQIGPVFDEILVSVSKGQSFGLPRRAEGQTGLRLVTDDVPGQGPIAGVLAGLKAARNDACMVIACDIPDIDLPLLRSLARRAKDAEIAVPVNPSGLYEPLFAAYRRSIAPKIESLLARGERSLLPLLESRRTAIVRFEKAGRIRNLNTREDYEAYIQSINGPVTKESLGTRRRRPAKERFDR